ncbi:M20 family metallopeptidase [Afifella pfennigii]|uniref:M20 family metallopeptidase n=1 Tax=Afifella pfennigii TaxID=209897 RepID=UPI00047DB341|nr:M20 family metallopeptidase [Afifella pfennigii]
MAEELDAARMKGDLARLVAIDTQNPPGREREGAAFVADLLRAAGYEVTLDEFRPGRSNVVARLANGAGPSLAFNTHIDVVPAGEGWSDPPLKLTEREGRLYGRGACDAKGPLVAMVEAMRMLAGERASWSGTLIGVFVADEEVASAGARHFAAGAPRIDYAVIGEPTGNATVIAHKGSMRPIVRVHGVSAHSGTPDLGTNAIFQAGRLLPLIEAFHHDVVRHRAHPLVGQASLTVTRMNGGVADNVVPDRCEMMLDRRLVPGEDEETAKAEIAELLVKAEKSEGIRAEIVEWRPTTGGAAETDPGEPIVAASLAAGRRHGAKVLEPLGFAGGCDLVHFNAIGARGVVVGPGSIAAAHKPDEFVPIEEFVAAARIYRDIAAAMLCGSPARAS